MATGPIKPGDEGEDAYKKGDSLPHDDKDDAIPPDDFASDEPTLVPQPKDPDKGGAPTPAESGSKKPSKVDAARKWVKKDVGDLMDNAGKAKDWVQEDINNLTGTARAGAAKIKDVVNAPGKFIKGGINKKNVYQLTNKTVREGVELIEAELKKPENKETAEDPIKRKDFVIKFFRNIDDVKYNPEILGAINEAVTNRATFEAKKTKKQAKAAESAEKINNLVNKATDWVKKDVDDLMDNAGKAIDWAKKDIEDLKHPVAPLNRAAAKIAAWDDKRVENNRERKKPYAAGNMALGFLKDPKFPTGLNRAAVKAELIEKLKAAKIEPEYHEEAAEFAIKAKAAHETVRATQIINKTVEEGIKLVEAELKKPENAKIAANAEDKKNFINIFLAAKDFRKFNLEVSQAVNEAVGNRAIFEKKNPTKRAINPDKLILATALAAHAGTSIVGGVVGGAWTVTKGAGRLAREEVISIGKGAYDLSKQVLKTAVYPFGRIGFGAFNRGKRGLNWAVKYPAGPNLLKAPEASEKSSKISALGRGMVNLTKRAWYRTKQGALIITAAPTAFVTGALEGAALSIQRDIIGHHTDGEASVSETGSREIKAPGPAVTVDGGVLGLGYSIFKLGKGIVWDAWINAFTEQLTTIKETPIPADEASPAAPPEPPSTPSAPDSSGGGSSPSAPSSPEATAPVAARKLSKGPVNTDKGGFFSAFKELSAIWAKDEMTTADFDEGITAIEKAFGSEDSVTGNLARGLRRLIGPKDVPTMEIDYENLGEQIHNLKPKERGSFFKSIDIIKLNKKFRLLIEATRFDEALGDADAVAEAKKQIAAFFGTPGAVDWDDLEPILNEMVDRLYGTPATPTGTNQVRFAAFMTRISGVLEEPGMAVADRRLTKLYGKEKKEMEINYSKFGEQIGKLKKTADKKAFAQGFNLSEFNKEFWMIMDVSRLAESLKDDDGEFTNKKAAKAKVSAILNIGDKVTPSEASKIIATLKETFTGVTGVDDKIKQIENALDAIAAALTDDNLDKIFGKDVKEFGIEYNQFGRQIVDLQDPPSSKDIEYFIKAFQDRRFKEHFSDIQSPASLVRALVTDPNKVRTLVAEFLGYKGSINTPEELDILVKDLADKLGVSATDPETDNKGKIWKALNNVEVTLNSTKTADDKDALKVLYPDVKEEVITIDYTKFGATVSNLRLERDKEAFLKAYNSQSFEDTFDLLFDDTQLGEISINPTIGKEIKNRMNSLFGSEPTSHKRLSLMITRIIGRLQPETGKRYTGDLLVKFNQIKTDLDRINAVFGETKLDGTAVTNGEKNFKLVYPSDLYLQTVPVKMKDFASSLLDTNPHKQSLLSFVKSIETIQFTQEFGAFTNDVASFDESIKTSGDKEKVSDQIAAFFSLGKVKPSASVIKNLAEAMLDHLQGNETFGLDAKDPILNKLTKLRTAIANTQTILTQENLKKLRSDT